MFRGIESVRDAAYGNGVAFVSRAVQGFRRRRQSSPEFEENTTAFW